MASSSGGRNSKLLARSLLSIFSPQVRIIMHRLTASTRSISKHCFPDKLVVRYSAKPFGKQSTRFLMRRSFSVESDYSTAATRKRMFQLLSLNSFTHEEILQAHNRYLSAQTDPGSELVGLTRTVWPDTTASLTAVEFEARILSLATKLDKQNMLPLILSYIGTGMSIGVIIPVLPLMVKELDLPTSSFGLVVSTFGLARLLGNIPAAGAVETWGRKPTLVAGITVCGASLALVSLTLLPGMGVPWLIGCRFISGLGVAAFGAAANMIISDISNPINRTRTFAPVLTSFQLGTSLGPVAGGLIVASVGIMDTYLVVGASIASIGLLNAIFLNESKPSRNISELSASSVISPQVETSPSKRFGLSATINKWRYLLRTSPPLRNMITMNGIYWVALSGTQMVLLPLFLVSEPLSLVPEQLGLAFALMSLVNVAVSQPVAILTDKYIGKVNSIILGTSLFALSTMYLPQVTSVNELWATLVVMSAGSTFLSTVPSALAADLSTSEDRAQTMALLRTSGDIGMLVGSICGGAFAQLTSLYLAIESNSVLLLLATVLYGAKNVSSIRLPPKK
jgi:MFS family permease